MNQFFEKKKNLNLDGFLFLFFLIPFFLSGKNPKNSPQDLTKKELAALNERHKAIQSLSEAIALVEQLHISPGDQLTSYDRAIEGLVKLDPHSAYLRPQDQEDFFSSVKGEFGGIGVTLTFGDSALLVVDVLPGPAKKAGIKTGDLIISVEGEFLSNDILEEGLLRLRGPLNSTVHFTVYRPHQPLPNKRSLSDYEGRSITPALTKNLEKGVLISFEIKRKKVKIPNFTQKNLEGPSLFLRIHSFLPNTHTEVERILTEQNQKKKLKGLLLDLRNNPGGSLDSVIKTIDLFISQGTIISTQGRLKRYNQVYEASERTPFASLPIVVLINGGSASASELLAASFQDHERALLVGEQTYKKGSFQELFPLQRGALKLTTGHFFSPSGKRIESDGVIPDIVLPLEEQAEEPFILTKKKPGKWSPKVWKNEKNETFKWDEAYLKEQNKNHPFFDPQVKVAYYKLLQKISHQQMKQKVKNQRNIGSITQSIQ